MPSGRIWLELVVASTIPRCHTLRELLEPLQWVVGREERWKPGSSLAVYPAEAATAPNLHALNSCTNQSESTDISSSDNAKFNVLHNTLAALTNSCPSSRSSLPGTDLKAFPA